MEEKEIGLYIHMPFCKQKCYYCDFVSYPNRYEKVERYIKCLKSEIVQYANENRIMHEHGLEPKFIIKTIYNIKITLFLVTIFLISQEKKPTYLRIDTNSFFSSSAALFRTKYTLTIVI